MLQKKKYFFLHIMNIYTKFFSTQNLAFGVQHHCKCANGEISITEIQNKINNQNKYIIFVK